MLASVIVFLVWAPGAVKGCNTTGAFVTPYPVVPVGVMTMLGVSTDGPAGWVEVICSFILRTVSERVKVEGVQESNVVPSKVTVKAISAIGICFSST